MNPNSDDPNNHVPPISPGDNWDDLDDSTERSRVGLPPRRVERGLPPKKESVAERVSLKTRILKLESDGETAPDDPSWEGDDAPAPPQDAAEISGKPPRKPRNKPMRRTKAKEAVPDEPVEPPEEAAEVAVILPRPKLSKRGRVNEINPGSEKPAARSARPAGIVVRAPSAEPDAEPKEEMRKRRRFSRGERADWGGNNDWVSLKWMLLTGLGVLVLVVLAVVATQRPDNEKVRRGQESQYSKMALDEEENLKSGKGTDVLDQLLSKRSQAESIFAVYASAESTDDFINLVHAPTRNRELIEREWKPLGMKAGWAPGGDSVWYVKEGNGIRFAVLEGILGDYKPFRAFFRQDEGELKMDWKATSEYCSADFAELKSGKGDGSEVRVWLSPTDFYTFSYPEDKYRSFRIMSPRGEMTIWGYVPRGSDLDKELLDLFQPGEITGEVQSEVQTILRLEPSGGDSLPEQWLIAGVVRFDWLDE